MEDGSFNVQQTHEPSKSLVACRFSLRKRSYKYIQCFFSSDLPYHHHRYDNGSDGPGEMRISLNTIMSESQTHCAALPTPGKVLVLLPPSHAWPCSHLPSMRKPEEYVMMPTP
jgi:hypothetical protein